MSLWLGMVSLDSIYICFYVASLAREYSYVAKITMEIAMYVSRAFPKINSDATLDRGWVWEWGYPFLRVDFFYIFNMKWHLLVHSKRIIIK